MKLKEYKKPRLIILNREHEEEFVLHVCKGIGAGAAGSYYMGCNVECIVCVSTGWS